MNISDLGFVKGRIIETIVTTYNSDKSPNAAPIGVHTAGDDEISMNIHTTSDTFNNVVRTGGCVINVVFDPYLFLKTCIVGSGKAGEENEVSSTDVLQAKNVPAPYLKEANAIIESKLISHKEQVISDRYKESEFSTVRFQIAGVTVIKRHPVAVTRGLYAAIELAISLSRGRGPDERYLKIMKKTLEKEEYDKIMELL